MKSYLSVCNLLNSMLILVIIVSIFACNGNSDENPSAFTNTNNSNPNESPDTVANNSNPNENSDTVANNSNPNENKCGNGELDNGEICDSDTLLGENNTCADINSNFEGLLKCSDDCLSLDTSDCTDIADKCDSEWIIEQFKNC